MGRFFKTGPIQNASKYIKMPCLVQSRVSCLAVRLVPSGHIDLAEVQRAQTQHELA